MRSFLFAALGSFAIFACTTTTTKVSPEPTASENPTETPEEEEDPGTPTPKPGGGKDNDACDAKSKCAAGYSCIGPGSGNGFCVKKCSSNTDCTESQWCKEGGDGKYCFTKCFAIGESGECDAGFICSKPGCIRSCRGVTNYCGAANHCDGDLCMPGGSTEPPPTLTCPATPPSSSGVTSTKTFGSLTTAEKGKYCDFTACGYGGYGQSKSCGGTTMSAPKSQADCLAKATWTKCASLTVAQAEACEKKMRVDWCNSLKVLTTDPDCAPVLACSK